MKLNFKLYKRNLIFGGGILLVGILLGWLLFGGNSNTTASNGTEHEHAEEDGTIWTCSMHPQIQQDEPGQCPLCGMDLIPLKGFSNEEGVLPDEVPMSASAMKLAEIQTMVVRKQEPEKELRLLGRVRADERLKFTQTAHIPGRIEALYINFTGEKVKKGQKLASIYSPELVTAQKELFEVLKDENSSPQLVNATRYKLKQWKLTDAQISELEQSKEVRMEFDILSDHSGYVMELNVADGDYIKEGQKLFHIVDLSKVWVLFEAYEDDLPWINMGDAISIEVRSVPGRNFEGKITFIDPFINPKTRVAYVRVELGNSGTLLKPDMFANGIISTKLSIDEPVILIPKSAALWTGKRAVVYIKLPDREHNSFLYREIILGEDAGDMYIVKTGLEEGEEIAVNGVFKIDAAAQLAGKKSMMNPGGGKSSTGGHAGMDMGGDKDAGEMDMAEMEPEVMIDKAKVPLEFKKQLGKVAVAYLQLKDKMVADDVEIKKEVAAFRTELKNVDMNLVLEDAHNVWMKYLKAINKALDGIEKEVNIDEQRIWFISISASLADATGKLGVEMPERNALYLEFCPMANDNAGAYWLSTEEKIKNPYFGAKMMKCGSVKETLTE